MVKIALSWGEQEEPEQEKIPRGESMAPVERLS